MPTLHATEVVVEVGVPKETPECKHFWVIEGEEEEVGKRPRWWVCKLCPARRRYRAGGMCKTLLPSRRIVRRRYEPLTKLAPFGTVAVPAANVELVVVQPPSVDVSVAPVRKEEPAPVEVVVPAPNGATPEVVVVAGVPKVQQCPPHHWVDKQDEEGRRWECQRGNCTAVKPYRPTRFVYDGDDEDELPLVEVGVEEPDEEETDDVAEEPLGKNGAVAPEADLPVYIPKVGISNPIAVIIAEEKARANAPLVRKASGPPVVLTKELLKALMEEVNHEP